MTRQHILDGPVGAKLSPGAIWGGKENGRYLIKSVL
jgi:hypothetical protein